MSPLLCSSRNVLGKMTKSLRLSASGIERARAAFDSLAVSQEAFVAQLTVNERRGVTRKSLGSFLRGEPIQKDGFALFCRVLGLEIAQVVAQDISQGTNRREIEKNEEGPAKRAIATLNSFLDDLDHEPHFVVRHIASSEELRELWLIDEAAYGDDAISLSAFYQWWECFESGLKAVFSEGRVVGAFGIWPLAEEQAEAFCLGQIKEVELMPLKRSECWEQPCPLWYVSGIVLDPALRHGGARAIHPLLVIGINLWLESFLVSYPLRVLAVASSTEGERMLERFAFVRIREANQMMDGHPLYILRASSRGDLTMLLKKRGLG